MENEFSKIMSEQSDKELIKILYVERHKYQKLAIESAEAELEKRKLFDNGMAEILEYEEEKIIDQYLVDFDIVGSQIRGFHFFIDLFLWMGISSLIHKLFIAIVPNGNEIVRLLIYAGTFLGYYGFMEFKYQKTLAKFVTKTKVVTSNGLKPDKEKIFIRTLSRLIPFEHLSYFVSVIGIHDRLSQTRVVKDNPNSVIEDDFEF